MVNRQLNVVAVITLILGIIAGGIAIFLLGASDMWGGSQVTFGSFVSGVAIIFSSYIMFLILRGLAIVVEKHEKPKLGQMLKKPVDINIAPKG